MKKRLVLSIGLAACFLLITSCSCKRNFPGCLGYPGQAVGAIIKKAKETKAAQPVPTPPKKKESTQCSE